MNKSFLIVLMLFATYAHAQKWTSGETTERSGAYAGTTNESGGILAQYCTYEDGNCYWTLSSGTTNCEEKESYPSMVNSDVGAFHVNMYCYKSGGRSRMAFKDFDEIDRVIKTGKTIAIVVPLASGSFRVSRFELVGAAPVINSMLESVIRKTKSSTKDRIL